LIGGPLELNDIGSLGDPQLGAVYGPSGGFLARRGGEKRMSRLSLFNSPLLLGFDHFERALDRVSKISSDGYPPYNIEQLGENALRITLAVAGFTMGDLSITVEDNQLVVRGKQTDDAQRVYLHRGIAARQFQRSFVLAEGIEVSGAWLDNGLLHIDLVRPEVESRVRTVEIKSGSTAAKRTAEASQN
jgi:HSP20 family molecular chaperone IbpA